jgi:hypothetical protein
LRLEDEPLQGEAAGGDVDVAGGEVVDSQDCGGSVGDDADGGRLGLEGGGGEMVVEVVDEGCFAGAFCTAMGYCQLFVFPACAYMYPGRRERLRAS